VFRAHLHHSEVASGAIHLDVGKRWEISVKREVLLLF
jgi:hypothetical protein